MNKRVDQIISAAEYRALAKKAKRSKYAAVPTVVDGIRFHSKGEARRWQELRLLERSGQIRNLQRQIPYALNIYDLTIGYLVVDFSYEEKWTGFSGKVYWQPIDEDWKGMITPLARWKLKHFYVQYGRKVRITGAARKRTA